MLKLKYQCFGHLMQRADLLEKTLMLAETEGKRRRGWPRMQWLDNTTDSRTWIWANLGKWWRTGEHGMLQSMGSQRVGPDWATSLSLSEIIWSTGEDILILYANTIPFYIKNLSICGFWYAKEVLEPIHSDSKGRETAFLPKFQTGFYPLDLQHNCFPEISQNSSHGLISFSLFHYLASVLSCLLS